MHKSLSTPNLSKLSISKSHMRKNVSTNALVDLSLMDVVVLSQAPVTQSVNCIVTTNFPDNIIEGKYDVDKELATCLLTPYEPPNQTKEHKPSSSTMNRKFMQLSKENEEFEQRYAEWLRRIRRNRQRQNK